MTACFSFAKIVSTCLFSAIMLGLGWKPGLAAPAVPPASFTKACSALVYDLDNDAILFEQNPDQPIPPASLTKVMSLFLALDFIKDGHASPDSQVAVSADASAAGGSSMGLRSNETVPLKKLLLGMAVSSGNDASYAVAEYVGGSAANFVKMMNARAAQLGMRDTFFENPHGLPASAQFTTARDMLTLARAYLKAHPYALNLHNTKVLEHGGYKSWNRNPLLGQYAGADGLKTGWIRASGYNMIFTATRNNRRLLAVIMGAPSAVIRGVEACRLLDAGFMVCSNAEVSVAAALDKINPDSVKIDIFKTARDSGLLKANKQKVLAARAGREPVKSKLARQRALGAKKLVASKKDASKKQKLNARQPPKKELATSKKKQNHAQRKAASTGKRG